MEQFNGKAMNGAASLAEKEWWEMELQDKYPEAIALLKGWMEKHFHKAGWKRLGYIVTERSTYSDTV